MWEERFWAKVDKSGECWLWTAGKNSLGYGSFRIGGDVFLAHRLAWGLAHREDPGDLCVCHRCDNPACVRAEHMFLGTRIENNRDRDRKGRWGEARTPPGEAHPNAKLTAERVREMRRRREKTGISHRELGREFGVSTMVAWRICERRSWKHVV